MKHITHLVLVKGRGRFPIDMLRYDGLAPDRGVDALIIEGSFEISLKEEQLVHLRRCADSKWTPSTDRWKSFGWTVVDVTEETFKS